MRKLLAWLRYSLCAAGMVAAIAGAAQTRRLIFLSTQLRPIEEAQKMRNVILKDFQRDVDYVPEQPQLFPVRIDAALQQGTTHTIDVVGALHSELQPLARLGALAPLDGLARKLTDRGVPEGAVDARQIRHCARARDPMDAGELHYGGQQSGALLFAWRGGYQRA